MIKVKRIEQQLVDHLRIVRFQLLIKFVETRDSGRTKPNRACPTTNLSWSIASLMKSPDHPIVCPPNDKLKSQMPQQETEPNPTLASDAWTKMVNHS